MVVCDTAWKQASANLLFLVMFLVQCIGPDCFRTAFLLLAGLAALSSLACCLATSRSRRSYVALAMHLKQVDIAEGGHGTVMQEDP